MTNQYIKYPLTGGGVSSLNTLTGDVIIVGGTGITVTPSGQDITISATNAGTVTAVTASAPLSSTGGATPNISITQSSTSTDGYLSSIDWNTFNSKQASGNYITALTGDGTASGPGSAVFTLSTVNTDTGSFGSSTSIPSFTVNGKGLITAASSNVVIAPAGTLTGTTLASNIVTSSLTSLGVQSQALNMNSFQINNLANGSLSGDAVNYGQLQAAISGLYWQGPAQAYSASNVPLTGGSTLTIDGYSVQNGDLIILGNQTTASQNGEYAASGIGTTYILTPNGLPTAAGDAWLILNGTVYSDTAFVANSAVPTATFTEFAGPTAYTFTSPLTLTGRTVSITQANTSTSGYLSSTDWNTFNNKQSALTFSDSLVNTAGTVTLVNDTASPSASQYYGTNSGSTLGYYNLPASSGGTVTSVSVATANGFAGTVATSTTIPAITVETIVTGILKGNGTAVSAAVAGTDYVIPSGSITGTSSNVTATSNSTLTTLTALSLPTSQLTGTLTVPNGGTGVSSFTANELIASGTTTTSPVVQIPSVSAGYVLTDNGSGLLPTFQPSPGTVSAFFAGPACTTQSTGITSNTFTTFSNSPTLTFTPGITGLYKVYCPANFQNSTSSNFCAIQIFNSAGSAILGVTSSGTAYSQGGNTVVTGFIENTYTLVAGTSYSFDIQGIVDSGTTVFLRGDIAQFYIFAELETTGTTGSPRSEIFVNTGNGSGSTNTYVRRWSNFTNGVNGAIILGTDITFADSASLGATFTINTTGIYAISYGEAQSVGDQFGISKNQITLTQAYSQISFAERVQGSSTSGVNAGSNAVSTLNLTSGDVIRGLWGNDGEGSTYFQSFRITRIN